MQSQSEAKTKKHDPQYSHRHLRSCCMPLGLLPRIPMTHITRFCMGGFSLGFFEWVGFPPDRHCPVADRNSDATFLQVCIRSRAYALIETDELRSVDYSSKCVKTLVINDFKSSWSRPSLILVKASITHLLFRKSSWIQPSRSPTGTMNKPALSEAEKISSTSGLASFGMESNPPICTSFHGIRLSPLPMNAPRPASLAMKKLRLSDI